MGRRPWKGQKPQQKRRASQLVLHQELRETKKEKKSKKGKTGKTGKKSSRYSRLEAIGAGDAPMMIGKDGKPIPTTASGEPDWVAYWKSQEAASLAAQHAKGAGGDGRSDDIAERLRSTFNGEGAKEKKTGTGSGPYHYGGYGSTNYVSVDRTLLIHDDEDKAKILGRFKIYTTDKDWWDIAKDYFPVEEPEEDKLFMFIPWKCALPGMTMDDPPFNACTFTATDDYLKARWGRSLHSTDRDWLGNHPLAADTGIPHEHTLLAVADLVRPYGLIITRARLRKGAFITGDGWMQWLAALGTNPLAMVDHSTSNKEAAERLGIDTTVVNVDDLWRFEFSDEPLYPSIICETGWTNNSTTGVQTGFGGGHARHLPPRGSASTWNLSFQLGPAEFSPPYDGPIEFPEYKKRTGVYKLTLSPIVGPDMLPFAERKNGFFKRLLRGVQELVSGGDATGVPGTSSPQSSKPDPYDDDYYRSGSTPSGVRGIRSYKLKDQKFVCSICYGDLPTHKSTTGKDVYAQSVVGLDRVCPMCYAEAWDDVNCMACKRRYYRSDAVLPQPSYGYSIDADPQEVKTGIILAGVFRCVCGADLHVKETDRGCEDLAMLTAHMSFDSPLPSDARGITNMAPYALNGAKANRPRKALPPPSAKGKTPAMSADPADAPLPLDESGPNALDADTPPIPKGYLDGIEGFDGHYFD